MIPPEGCPEAGRPYPHSSRSGIAPASSGRTDGEEIVVVNGAEVRGGQREQGAGLAGGSGKLDFEPVRRMHMDDGTEIPGTETGFGDVVVQDDGVKFPECRGHLVSSGYAVINRGRAARSVRIHTARRLAVVPVGPSIVPRTR